MDTKAIGKRQTDENKPTFCPPWQLTVQNDVPGCPKAMNDLFDVSISGYPVSTECNIEKSPLGVCNVKADDSYSIFATAAPGLTPFASVTD